METTVSARPLVERSVSTGMVGAQSQHSADPADRTGARPQTSHQSGLPLWKSLHLCSGWQELGTLGPGDHDS